MYVCRMSYVRVLPTTLQDCGRHVIHIEYRTGTTELWLPTLCVCTILSCILHLFMVKPYCRQDVYVGALRGSRISRLVILTTTVHRTSSTALYHHSARSQVLYKVFYSVLLVTTGQRIHVEDTE